MNRLVPEQMAQLERWQWRSLAVGVAALISCAVGGVFTPGQFFRAYLVAYLFFLGLAHGCLAVLMLYYLTGGAWGYLIRRTLEAAIRTLPLLALLFIPIGFGVPYLYVWANQDIVAANPIIQQKAIYLNWPFFCARAALFFFLWLLNAYLLLAWSRRQEETDDPVLIERYSARLGYVSGPGLIVFGITITFASVDWVMSLQPAFRSTIFGPLFASGEILSGFAGVLIVLAWLLAQPPLSELVSVEALNDLGNLLFTFLVIWAYLVFFQFMLIWIANLPYDSRWYDPRLRGGWYWVAVALFVLHFVVPFFLLLMRPIKRNPRSLAQVAALLLFMQLVYMNFQILPVEVERSSAGVTRLWKHWLDFVAPLGLGGLWLANFLYCLKQRSILPANDLNSEAALHYREADRERQALLREAHHV
jgi:hypothetical protein